MKSKANFFLVFLLFISFLLFFSNTNPLSSNFIGSIQGMFSNPMSFFYNIKIKVLNTSFSKNEELEKLKNENRKLLEKLADYEKLKSDINAYHDQFESREEDAKKLTPSRVIGFLGDYNFPKVLIIDKGKSTGLKPGLTVVFENNLVGVIDKVSGAFSNVILPTNTDFSIVGKSLSNNTIGVLKGEGDFIVFDKVAITDELKKDDLIVAKGDVDEKGVGVVPDVVIGKILSVNKTENKPFQNARIQPMLDYSKLEIVFVMMPLN